MAKSKRARTLGSRTVFRGRVFHVTSDTVREPGGVTARRDVVRHPGSVVVLAAETRRGVPHILLARQYRHAAGAHLWELPAGRIDSGEAVLAAARRELLEETGFRASRWTRALSFYSSPGFLDEVMHLCLARGLRRGQAQPEADEVISTRLFPLPRLLAMARQGRLRDGKTLVGVLWFAGLRSARTPRQLRLLGCLST